jgi:hypothetical protein
MTDGILPLGMSTSSVASAASRALCVVRDPTLRRTLRRTLLASGAPVEFRESLEGDDLGAGVILFLDSDHRSSAEIPRLMQIIGEHGRIVIVGDSLADMSSIELLRHRRLDHMISEDTPDEVELVVTAGKLLSGDIFGLEKYMSWGVTVTEAEVSTYEHKRAALLDVARMAETLGARRQLVTKIEGTADELLMNALYDAPAARGMPNEQFRRDVRTGNVPLDLNGGTALLRYACDGRHFAVSVLDRYGALDKQTILESVLRARNERGRPRDRGGAGLGLYFVLSSVTRFIVNIEPDRRTEVVCLFDLRERGKDAESWARSLHIFTTP